MVLITIRLYQQEPAGCKGMRECTRSQGSLRTQALKHILSHERMANTGSLPTTIPHWLLPALYIFFYHKICTIDMNAVQVLKKRQWRVFDEFFVSRLMQEVSLKITMISFSGAHTAIEQGKKNKVR